MNILGDNIFWKDTDTTVFESDMSYRKIIHYLVKMSLHMTLIGSRIKFRVVLSSGLESEKPVTLLRKSDGNAGSVNILLSALLKMVTIMIHQVREKHWHWRCFNQHPQ